MSALHGGLAAAICLLLLIACTATLRPGDLEPVRGIASIESTAAGWRVEVPGGIGRFRVVLPAQATAEVELVYATGRPFTRLEGVQVVGHPGEVHPAIASDGAGRLRIAAGDTPIDLTLVAIDYYR
jgi:hypothetical protein